MVDRKRTFWAVDFGDHIVDLTNRAMRSSTHRVARTAFARRSEVIRRVQMIVKDSSLAAIIALEKCKFTGKATGQAFFSLWRICFDVAYYALDGAIIEAFGNARDAIPIRLERKKPIKQFLTKEREAAIREVILVCFRQDRDHLDKHMHRFVF